MKGLSIPGIKTTDDVAGCSMGSLGKMNNLYIMAHLVPEEARTRFARSAGVDLGEMLPVKP